MNGEELATILSQDEDIKLDFKREYHLEKQSYPDTDKQEWALYINGQWDELIKDIISLTNGNVGVPNKNGTLIIGADDIKSEDGNRKLYDSSYLNINSQQVLSKVNSACQPPIPRIIVEYILVNTITLIVITIPPSPYVHETIRPLVISKGFFNSTGQFVKYENIKTYSEYTAFIRKGESISPASWVERQELLKDKKYSILSINENVKTEIVHNLTKLLLKVKHKNTDPCWLFDSIECQKRLELNKPLEISSLDLYKITLLFQTAASASNNLSTQFLDEAIKSADFFVYDEIEGTLKKEKYYEYLILLQRTIVNFQKIGVIVTEDGYKFLSEHGSKIKPESIITVYSTTYIRILAFLFRFYDILAISKSILNYLLDPTINISEPKLKPSTPIESEIEKIEAESVNEKDVWDWVKIPI